MAGTNWSVPLTERIGDYVALLAGLPWVDPDASLISGHVVDSLAAVQMIVFVEREFGVTVEDEDLELRHFDSVRALARLVAGKLASSQP
jgi:methoxymalonate biosynthesis acyl carrier protein